MRTKFHFHIKDKATASANDRDKGSIRAKAGTSVGSVFSSVLGNKRSRGKYPSKPKKNGKEWHVAARPSSKELARSNEPEPVVASLSHFLTLEQTPERAGDGKGSKKNEQRVKMNIHIPTSLLSFLGEKKKGWDNSIRAKLRTARFNKDLHGAGAVTRFGEVRGKVSSWRLVRIRILSTLLVIRLKLKMITSMVKRKVAKQFEQGSDEDNDRELCKKRILMGARCKALCSSGTLSYDTDGILLPDILP